MCQSHRRFHRRVASAYHKNFLVHVVVGFDKAVHHFWQFFARHAEFARAAGFAERQDDVTGSMLPFGGVNEKGLIR